VTVRSREVVPQQEDQIPDVFPSWFSRSGWLVVGAGVLGGLAAPAFNVHASLGPIAILAIGLGISLWLSPLYLIGSTFYLMRARSMGTPPPMREWIEMALFGLGSAALLALALSGP
jgi:hypothetical protein